MSNIFNLKRVIGSKKLGMIDLKVVKEIPNSFTVS